MRHYSNFSSERREVLATVFCHLLLLDNVVVLELRTLSDTQGRIGNCMVGGSMYDVAA